MRIMFETPSENISGICQVLAVAPARTSSSISACYHQGVHCSDGGGGSLGVDPDDVGGLPVDGLQPVVGALSRRLDVVVVVVRETVAEPLVVQPLLPKAEVEHRECAIAGDLLVHCEELWQFVSELFSGKGGVGFQKNQSAAPWMARLLVDVQLEILVVVHEAPADLVYRQVERVLLINQVGVVAMGERGLHLDHLTSHLFADGVDVRVFALPPSLP